MNVIIEKNKGRTISKTAILSNSNAQIFYNELIAKYLTSDEIKRLSNNRIERVVDVNKVIPKYNVEIIWINNIKIL